MGGQGPETTKHQVEMGRGKSWDLHENETLARAWIAASEDPVVGIDQRGKVLFDRMHRCCVIDHGPVPLEIEQCPRGRVQRTTPMVHNFNLNFIIDSANYNYPRRRFRL